MAVHAERAPAARTIKDFCRHYGIGKTLTYELMAAGTLVALKAAGRTLIDEASARAWYASLPRTHVPLDTHARTHAVPTDTGGRVRAVANTEGRKA